MWRAHYGGRLNPNVKVTLTKHKENSLLANCGHLWCEKGINLPMPKGLITEIVKDWKKRQNWTEEQRKFIYPTYIADEWAALELNHNPVLFIQCLTVKERHGMQWPKLAKTTGLHFIWMTEAEAVSFSLKCWVFLTELPGLTLSTLRLEITGLLGAYYKYEWDLYVNRVTYRLKNPPLEVLLPPCFNTNL